MRAINQQHVVAGEIATLTRLAHKKPLLIARVPDSWRIGAQLDLLRHVLPLSREVKDGDSDIESVIVLCSPNQHVGLNCLHSCTLTRSIPL